MGLCGFSSGHSAPRRLCYCLALSPGQQHPQCREHLPDQCLAAWREACLLQFRSSVTQASRFYEFQETPLSVFIYTLSALPPLHRTQAGGYRSRGCIYGTEITRSSELPSPRRMKTFLLSQSLCLAYFSLNPPPGGFSAPVQITSSSPDVSQRAGAPADPPWALPETLYAHVCG